MVAAALFLLLGAASDCYGAWLLAENRESKAVVVLEDGAGAVKEHAAEELCYFIGRVTGAEVRRVSEPVSGKYSIWLFTPERGPGLPVTGIVSRVESLSEHGYLLHADSNGLIIAGRNPLGVLYGVYGFLEDYVGLRWFFPGEDGTFIPDMPSFSISPIDDTQNPSFEKRQLRLGSTSINARMVDTWDWIARNRMQSLYPAHPRWREEHEKRGNRIHGGGHVLGRMVPPELFDEHPEYFPLYGGERLDPRKLERSQDWNPCTTHPEVINLAVDYTIAWFEENPGGVFTLNNNDFPHFCECENCIAIDPPEEDGRGGGNVATRFFAFKNEVARRVWKTIPDARIRTLAYHGFRLPPLGVVPDSRLRVDLCDQRSRCYRHGLVNLNCNPNEWFRGMFEGWSEFDNVRGNYTYYASMLSGPEIVATPVERVIAADMRYMHGLGHSIWTYNTHPPDGSYDHMLRRGRDPEKPKNYWRANLHAHYIMAKLAWDIDLDVEELMRDINMKYYGPAGDAMQNFRLRLLDLWEETPGHFIRPSPMSLMGRTLKAPGAVDELAGYLEEARKASAGSGAYLERVERDMELFARTWLVAFDDYSSTARLRDVTVSRREGDIEIDGRLDESCWLESERVTGFVRRGGGLAEAQTYVRLLYDDDYLYAGLEMEEPLTGQLVMNASPDGGGIFNDDTVELFIDPEGERQRYIHIAVNPKGVMRDSEVRLGMPRGGDAGFNTGAEAAARIEDNTWTAEFRIPLESLGAAIREGDRWTMCVGRARRPGKEPEASTWSDGVFHNTESFRNVLFGSPVIANGRFEDIYVMDTERKRRHMRSNWLYLNHPPVNIPGWTMNNSSPGKLKIIDEDTFSGSYSLQVAAREGRRAEIFTWLNANLGKDDEVVINFAARGEGKLWAGLRYYGSRDPVTGEREVFLDPVAGTEVTHATIRLGSVELGEEWEEHEFRFKQSGEYPENAALFISTSCGPFILDDVHVRIE